jgi:histidine triad (HIT) family protein
MEKDCIFCKIVSGEIPTHFTYEDEVVVAFPDIHPAAPGHTLLIPKEHHQWFYEVPDAISDTWFSAAKQLAQRLKAEQGADYVRLTIVGKDVPHAHIHLIPQKLSDKTPAV